MNISGYDLYSIETSGFALDGGAMFGIIPKPVWEKEAPADNQNRIDMVTRSLLLVGHGRKIIVDTGNGDKWQAKFKAIYNIDTETAVVQIFKHTQNVFHSLDTSLRLSSTVASRSDSTFLQT